MIRIVQGAIPLASRGKSSHRLESSAAADSPRPNAMRRRRLDLIEHAAVTHESLDPRSTHLWHVWLTAGQPAIVLLTAEQSGLELAIWLPDGQLRDTDAASSVEQLLVFMPSDAGRSTICVHNRSDSSIAYELLLP